MIRNALQDIVGDISRREFISTLGKKGIGPMAAGQFAGVLAARPEEKSITLENVTGGHRTCETFKLWDIDHVGIARSYGLKAERDAHAAELVAAMKRAIESEKSGKAYVLNVIIDKRGGGAESDWHEKHLPTFSS